MSNGTLVFSVAAACVAITLLAALADTRARQVGFFPRSEQSLVLALPVAEIIMLHNMFGSKESLEQSCHLNKGLCTGLLEQNLI